MTALKNIAMILGFMVLGSFVLIEIDRWQFSTFRYGADNTDGPTRSQMALFTDAKTGCQYLGSAWGGITPRMDNSGNHICQAN